ncbi:hypothetical protein RHGRI_010479 [Rhododendron griersonianum]|uniref:Uncharacterized protein n=1 Tax=Rhododendron griersonianum TaxID=479676 RepID=A0AAV6KJG9_9ERIC|nr:hypothetical protein RHGRI_010479 [Rhododendron griersonianum]
MAVGRCSSFCLAPSKSPDLGAASMVVLRCRECIKAWPWPWCLGVCGGFRSRSRVRSVVGRRDRRTDPLANTDFWLSVFFSIGACRDNVGLPRRFPPLLRCENSFAPSTDGVSYPRPKTAGVLFG